MMSHRWDATGWFIDIDEDASIKEAPWTLWYQYNGSVAKLDGVWFYSEEDAIDFLKREILPTGNVFLD